MGALLLLCAVGAAAPSTADAQTLPSIWRDFYQGCAEDPAHRHLCACAATEFMDRCLRLGSRAPMQMAACIERNQDAWLDPVVNQCMNFGALHVAGPITTPAPRAVAGRGAPMSQLELWNASYEGCSENMTAGVHHEYACACVATFVVQTCAVSGAVPAGHVSSCVPAMSSEIERVTPACMQYGSLATGTVPPPPAAAPAPTTTASGGGAIHPVAQTLCGELDGLPDTAQRAECGRLMTTVIDWNQDAFLGYLPTTGTIRLFRNGRANAAAVRSHFERNRGLEVIFSAPRPAVFVVQDRGAPLLVLFDSDVVDMPAVEARFRWSASSARWEMVSIDRPPPD